MMNRMIIYNLARKGLTCEEPETKDAIFKAIKKVAMEKDVLDVELPVEQVLKDGVYSQAQYVKLSEEAIKEAKNKYSTFKGYSKLQLALDFFQMTNDMFFVVYGFNYVPEGKVRDAARKMIDMQSTMNMISETYKAPAINSLNISNLIGEEIVKSTFKDTFRSAY